MKNLLNEIVGTVGCLIVLTCFITMFVNLPVALIQLLAGFVLVTIAQEVEDHNV